MLNANTEKPCEIDGDTQFFGYHFSSKILRISIPQKHGDKTVFFVIWEELE
jgi:uncharacterized membrane protein